MSNWDEDLRPQVITLAMAAVLLAANGWAQIPTAYQSIMPTAAGQMYMESIYLPSVTTGPVAPTWSPDGREIAFALHGSLWKVPAEGGEAVEITSGPGYDSEPQWSADGRRIVFTRDTGHQMELYLVNADGSELRQLTHAGGINVDPEWHSPDLIYYTSSVN